jgi:hypothetical protein
MLRGKLTSFVLCLLFILALFSFNQILVKTPTDINPLMEEDYDDKKNGANIVGNRATRATPGWMEEIRLTNSPGDSTRPEIAVWESNVHVVWRDNRDGEYGIYYKKSIDNGSSWSTDTKLSSASWEFDTPKISVHEANIHLVWESLSKIHYINSTDNGDSWGSVTVWDWTSYPPSSMNDMITHPDIATWGNHVYISACADGPDDVIFKRSTDNGDSWTGWILVNDLPTPAITSIEIDGSKIYVIYLYGSGSFQSIKGYESNAGIQYTCCISNRNDQ